MPYKITALSLCLSLLPLAIASAQQAPPTYGAPITLEAAKRVVAAAEAEARKNNFTMVITILDSGGTPVLMQRMDGTQLGSVKIAEAKAATAINFKRSSKVFQDGIAAGGENMRFLSMPGVIAVEGGELLMSGNTIIGSIGVSGGTSAQDTQVAKAGIAALAK